MDQNFVYFWDSLVDTKSCIEDAVYFLKLLYANPETAEKGLPKKVTKALKEFETLIKRVEAIEEKFSDEIDEAKRVMDELEAQSDAQSY